METSFHTGVAFFSKVFNILVIVVIFLVLLETNSKWINSFAGPYNIEVRRITHCSEDTSDNRTAQYYIRDSRTRHTQMLRFSGNMTMPFTLNDSLGARLTFASWGSGGGWKDNAFVLKFDRICASLNLMVHSQWSNLAKAIFGENIPCPLLAGIYRFENLLVDLRKIPIKQFPYGKWRVDSMVVDHEDVRGCLRLFADTVPLLD